MVIEGIDDLIAQDVYKIEREEMSMYYPSYEELQSSQN